MLAQRCRGAETGQSGDEIDREVGCLQEVTGPFHPLAGQPPARADADLVAEAAGEGARAHPRVGGQLPQCEGPLEPSEGPGPGGGGGGRRGLWNRTADVLRLAAVAPRWDDARPGRRVRHLAAVVAAYDVQAQVHPGGDSRGHEHVVVRTVSDLRGKRVATPSIGATMHVSLLNWLSREGVDAGSVTAVETPFPTMADQLAAGRVDAVEAVEPFLGLLRRSGNRAIGSPILSVGEPPVVSVVWIASRGWAEDNRSVVARWNASLVEAERLIESDPQRAREILRKYTELPDEVARSARLPSYNAAMPPAELAARLRPWEGALERAGQFSGQVPDRLVIDAASR